MKKIAIAILIGMSTARGMDEKKAVQLSGEQVSNIRGAIWIAEGGAKAHYAYGVTSEPYHSLSEARQICENSIRNNSARWVASGMTNNFIPFMAQRYCPLDQKNWTRNVEFYCKHPKT